MRNRPNHREEHKQRETSTTSSLGLWRDTCYGWRGALVEFGIQEFPADKHETTRAGLARNWDLQRNKEQEAHYWTPA